METPPGFFKLVLRVLPADFTVRLEQPLTLADPEPEPDLSVARGRDSDVQHAHPATAALVVEIAVSSADLDRELAPLYAEAGIEEYWIVLAPERAVEVYRRPMDGLYQEKTMVAAGAALPCASVPGVAISLDELFA